RSSWPGRHLQTRHQTLTFLVPWFTIYTDSGDCSNTTDLCNLGLCQTILSTRPVLISCSTRTIRSIGTGGGKKHLKKRVARTSQFCSASVIRHVTGAT